MESASFDAGPSLVKARRHASVGASVGAVAAEADEAERFPPSGQGKCAAGPRAVGRSGSAPHFVTKFAVSKTRLSFNSGRARQVA